MLVQEKLNENKIKTRFNKWQWGHHWPLDLLAVRLQCTRSGWKVQLFPLLAETMNLAIGVFSPCYLTG